MVASVAPLQAGRAQAAALAPATVVMRNGAVHTMDAQRRVVSAIAWRGRELVAVGSDADMQAWIGKGTRVLDLAGAMVLPGLIDAHIHPIGGALNLAHCDMNNANVALEELVRAARDCLARRPLAGAKDWLQIVGVSAIGLSIDRHVVDRIAVQRPVVLWGGDGHLAWVNSAGLAASHIDRATPDPPGGHIGRDAQGEPDGYFVDDALSRIAVPAPTVAQALPLAKRGLDLLTAAGITSIQDADSTPFEREVYAQLERRGQLQLRVVAVQHQEPVFDPAAVAEAVRVRERFAHDPLIRADSVKLFLDGTLEFPYQTAALIAPYLDAQGRPTQKDGGRYYDKAQLDHVVEEFDRLGFTIHYHSIGDRAAREGLDAIEAAIARNGPMDRRHQLAHLELVDDADMPRMARLGVIANLQLDWALPDVWAVDGILPYIGAERHRNIYAARSLQLAGVRLAGGSDWPVSTYLPLHAMRQAMLRDYPADQPPANRSRLMDVLHAEQRLDIGTLLAMYTIDAAYALRQESRTGSLEAGKLADLVVFDRDLTVLAPKDLMQARVKFTVFDGRVVYRGDAAPAR
jgi:predicted amidohydrolase YtcJ